MPWLVEAVRGDLSPVCPCLTRHIAMQPTTPSSLFAATSVAVSVMSPASSVHDFTRDTDRLYTTHTHTRFPFNGPFFGTTRVSRYQKGKTNLDFTEARDSEWQWHQLGHMQVCISLQTDNHASNPPLSFFTGRMPFLPPNQQRQCDYIQRINN